MGLIEWMKRRVGGGEPTMVDFEQYEQTNATLGTGTYGPDRGSVLGKVGPGGRGMMGGSQGPMVAAGPNTYKLQQSYDSLLSTVQELRAMLDGQAKRQDEMLDKIQTLPQAVEALPQTSKMQSDMLKLINDRLSIHAEQHRKVSAIAENLGPAKKEYAEALSNIKEQIEMGNEIDRQLVESFNRFSMMIDRLQLANQHAVDALQQVRDSYAQSAMQMQEWIERSRHRNGWLVGGAFVMSGAALVIVLVLLYSLMQVPGK